MSDTLTYSSDVAFTPAVKAIQARKGSRDAYAGVEQQGGWRTEIDEQLTAFLAAQDSMFLATATADGQPYIQHRGGPKGFIKVLDARTLAFADFAGNRQYITLANLGENDRAYLFLLDFASRHRVKIWGRARVIEDDAELLGRLADPSYRARPERVIAFTIEAWDTNCPSHITPRFTEAEIRQASAALIERIASLEAEVARLRGQGTGNER
jgi:uncharacterized protein